MTTQIQTSQQPVIGGPLDLRGRGLHDLRLSVTDRCNLRCSYCMPETDYTWLPRPDILSFEEIERLVAAFTAAGVTKVRLTGGEPLLRRDLPSLVARLAANSAITDLALTTNGTRLAAHARDLHGAGLGRVTVSLDTLDRATFQAVTGRDELDSVLEGIDAVAVAGFGGTKLNVVVQRGVNEHELGDLIDYGGSVGAEVRFIEYMDVGGATAWNLDAVVSAEEILKQVGEASGGITEIDSRPSAPARRYRLGDGRTFGIVSSTTQPFCATCDRSRITADGMWYRCLYATAGTDLRAVLRASDDATMLDDVITRTWQARDDQGAVERLSVTRRESLVPVEILRRNPHLEMHTRGG